VLRLIFAKVLINFLYKIKSVNLVYYVRRIEIGDWGLGIVDWGLGPIPNPQSPIPNPQSPNHKKYNIIYVVLKINKKL